MNRGQIKRVHGCHAHSSTAADEWYLVYHINIINKGQPLVSRAVVATTHRAQLHEQSNREYT